MIFFKVERFFGMDDSILVLMRLIKLLSLVKSTQP